MKKHNLLKIIAICFLVVVVLSWLIPTGSFNGTTFTQGETSPVGIVDLFRLPVMTMQTFVQYFIVILAVGAFYGVVNKTEVYSNLVNGIAKRWKGKEKKILVIITIALSLLSTLTGNSMLLFATVPFLGAILLSIGFDKISVMMATIGSILVGEASSILGFAGFGYVVNMLNINMQDEIFTRIILYILLTGLYLFFVAKKSKIVKVEEVVEEKKTRGRKSSTLEPVKKTETIKIPFLGKETNTNKSKIPFIVIVLLGFIVCLVCMYNWYYGLGVTLFNKLYTKITEVSIGSYPLMSNILSGMSSFGYWSNYELAVTLIVVSIIIAWVYNIKMDDFIDGAIKGMKEILPVAVFATICNVVFIVMIAGETEFLATIINRIGGSGTSFSLPVVAISSFIGSLFYNDLYYLLTDMIGIVLNYDAIYYPIAGIVINAIYSIVMMIVPTSVVLVMGLKYYGISLKEWLKTIWTYLIEAFVVTIIIAVVVVVLI